MTQLPGVKETVNGEIEVYEALPDGSGYAQITDLDRLEERIEGGFQIAEHKASSKVSILDRKDLDEVIDKFFQRDSINGNLHLKTGFTTRNVVDEINTKTSGKQKKAFLKARRKYIQSLVNKAKAISAAKADVAAGGANVIIKLTSNYTGLATDNDPVSLKSKLTTVRIVVFRNVEEGNKEQIIPISEHTEKTIELFISLALSEIEQNYGDIEMTIEFQRIIK
ncbi:MAG: hypothetical protein F6K31_17410 [Symploca sp. SIO2G7]|nr:hypothetical protein [Symploca sp. SIO2G7]